jgi:hypothetical protein
MGQGEAGTCGAGGPRIQGTLGTRTGVQAAELGDAAAVRGQLAAGSTSQHTDRSGAGRYTAVNPTSQGIPHDA